MIEGLSITYRDFWHLVIHPGSFVAWVSSFGILIVRLFRRRPANDWIERSDEIPILFWALFISCELFGFFDSCGPGHSSVTAAYLGEVLVSLGLLSMLILFTVIGRWRAGRPQALSLSLVSMIAVVTVLLDHVVLFALMVVFSTPAG